MTGPTQPKTLAEIHADLQAYLYGDSGATDPYGYLETLENELGQIIAQLDTQETEKWSQP
jgi:hypothetical protein